MALVAGAGRRCTYTVCTYLLTYLLYLLTDCPERMHHRFPNVTCCAQGRMGHSWLGDGLQDAPASLLEQSKAGAPTWGGSGGWLLSSVVIILVY